MLCGTISGVTKAISRARSSKSVVKAAKSAEVPTDITVRNGLCERNTGGIATCSALPASRMIVSNMAFHGYWLPLPQGDDDRHHGQSSFPGGRMIARLCMCRLDVRSDN